MGDHPNLTAEPGRPSPFGPCPSCGHQPAAGLAVEVSPMNRALFMVGSERGAIDTAYKLAPDAPRDLLRAIVRWVRATDGQEQQR